MPGASTSRSYGSRVPSPNVTDLPCASTAVAVARASVMPSAATRSYVNCCADSSRKPPITALLNGHAVNVWFASTNVTAILGSSCRKARAQLAPAKPPPTTTTRGAAWAKVGSGKSAAEAATPSFRNSRRLAFTVASRTRPRWPGSLRR